LLFLISDSNQN